MTDTAPAWPDPARPGTPLNPERDGWHWVIDEMGAEIVAHWFVNDSIEGPVWAWQHETGYMPVSFAAAEWRYLGPCFTSAEVAARVDEAVAKEQERAVLCATNWLEMCGASMPEYVSPQQWANDAIQDIIDAIRAGGEG